MKEKLKILMLGWEFPPILTGGLGIACFGLSKALSKYVELTVIVPQSDAHFPAEGFNLIGLNHFPYPSPMASPEEKVPYDYANFATLHKINIALNPYPVYTSDPSYSIQETQIEPNVPSKFSSSNLELTSPQEFHEMEIMLDSTPGLKASEAYALFQDKDIYGPNIMRKVAAYTEIVCQLSQNLDFDLIHAHDWITFAAALKIKEQSGKPLVVHIHSLETDRVNTDARNEVYFLEKYAMEQADRVVPVSDFTKKNIIQYYGIASEKITTVHNGVESVQKFKQQKENPKEQWVVFLGRVTRQKGPFMILETALKLIKRMPTVRFYVAGLGDQLGHLKYLVDRSGVSSYFVFTGFISKKEVGELLSRADVYFMPSISEPFGLSALEAAQFEVPCIISKQSGVSELMPNALKADFWDTDKFSDLLHGVLNFEGIRETLVSLTRKDLEKINWERSAITVFEKVYQELT